MKVEYCGARSKLSCTGREALVSWNDGEERLYNRIVELLRSRGWEQVGYAICCNTDDIPMSSREEYEFFLGDWKKVKRIAIAEMREQSRRG